MVPESGTVEKVFAFEILTFQVNWYPVLKSDTLQSKLVPDTYV